MGIGDLKLGPNFFAGMRTTVSRNAASNLNMPALSPTMTEGTISSWKVKEGSFHLTTTHLGKSEDCPHAQRCREERERERGIYGIL